MSKYARILGVAVLVGLALVATASIALAQDPTPVPPAGGYYGRGMMGGRFGYGMMGSGAWGGGRAGGAGWMAEYQSLMHAQLAEALDMTLDEFNAAIASGQTPFSLAQEKGIDPAVIQAAMQAAHAEALQQAVKDGKITQAQADWMLARQAQMQAWHAQSGYGYGPMMGRGFGAGGFRAGGFGGACPMFAATPAP